jgi:hypothetical protein
MVCPVVIVAVHPCTVRCALCCVQAFQYLAGAALMMLYLAVDGLTSTWQDSLFQGYNMNIADQVGGTEPTPGGLSRHGLGNCSSSLCPAFPVPWAAAAVAAATRNISHDDVFMHHD